MPELLRTGTKKVKVFGGLAVLFFCLLSNPSFADTELKVSSAAASSSLVYLFDASKAIDNNLNTTWIGGFPKTYWWLSLDLGQTYSLTQISIWWNRFLGSTNYNIQASNDGVNWVNLYSNLSSAGGTTNPYKLTYSLSKANRYIRLYINRAQLISPVIYEVKLYGLSSDTTPPTGTIKINNGVQYTNSSSVTLNLLATDSYSGLSQMQFSNDNATWSTPQAYATTVNWTLASGDGTKTVYVKYKDVAGNWSSAFSSTIILDTASPTGTITINNGNQYTNATSITLTLNANDSGSGLSQMQFSNDGITWLIPETYTITKTWTLTTGDGTKTIYVKFSDAAGNWSQVYSAAIILDTTAPELNITSPLDNAVIRPQ